MELTHLIFLAFCREWQGDFGKNGFSYSCLSIYLLTYRSIYLFIDISIYLLHFLMGEGMGADIQLSRIYKNYSERFRDFLR